MSVGLGEREREYTAAAATRAALADKADGFNRSVLSLERVLEAFQRRFDRGFPGDDAPALMAAHGAAGTALDALRRLRWALASPPARAVVDAIHAGGRG
jgi:hypothetical protein